MNLDPDSNTYKLFKLAFLPIKKNSPCCILGPIASLMPWIPSTPFSKFLILPRSYIGSFILQTRSFLTAFKTAIKLPILTKISQTPDPFSHQAIHSWTVESSESCQSLPKFSLVPLRFYQGH